ncbi:ATP-binding protein [Luteolibacter algae]|uniref:histidine kinase n=1 Tax=Luteolibacter algae TaxID=454151 RepID=A0ABW5DAE0_9BACT
MEKERSKTDECALEPIHLLGKIQSHGILIGMGVDTGLITHVSENVKEILDLDPAEILETPFVNYFEGLNRDGALSAMDSPAYLFNNPFRITSKTSPAMKFDGVVHRSGDSIILELERSSASPDGVDDYFRLTSNSLLSLQSGETIESIAGVMALEIRQYTGFDRVMVYRFDSDWNGKVVGENHKAGMTSFLGLRFPASDIPPQARELYKKSLIRLVRDTGDEPAGILASASQDAAKLDLSLSVLRAVSPIHIQYLKNMGVGSSMSISLLTPSGELWGLIACHHDTPMTLDYSARAACTHYGQVLASKLIFAEIYARQAEEIKRRENLPKAIRCLASGEDIQKAIVENGELFLKVFDADGIAVVENGWTESYGSVPGEDALASLLKAVPNDDALLDLWTTRSISGLGGEPCGSAGLLSLRIGKDWHIAVFRDEYVEKDLWGGDPEEYSRDSRTGKLGPRESFAAYMDIVKGLSREWTEIDRAIAAEIRSSLGAFLIDRSQRVARLNLELVNRNSELQQFAYSVSHDLKSPLITVNGYVRALEEDLDEGDMEQARHSLSRISFAVEKMGGLIDELLVFSRIGREGKHAATVNMETMMSDLREEFSERIRESGVRLVLPEKPLDLIGVESDIVRAFRNLIDNALKYMTPGHPEPEICLSCSQSEKSVVYKVVDNGPGIPPQHHERVFRLFERLDNKKSGSGVGLALVKKVIEQAGGNVKLLSEEGSGTTFVLTFPAV